jgi:hypothetical protein
VKGCAAVGKQQNHPTKMRIALNYTPTNATANTMPVNAIGMSQGGIGSPTGQYPV